MTTAKEAAGRSGARPDAADRTAGDQRSPHTHYLLPGTVFAEPHPHLVTTIVGSCVAVCLWDPAVCIGGMNHYLLPLWNGQGIPSPRYGNVAIAMLMEKLQSHGCLPGRLRAKIFGGGSVWPGSEGLLPVGERNIDLAYEILASLRIPVVAADVGGHSGRKIIFDSASGEVLVRRHTASE